MMKDIKNDSNYNRIVMMTLKNLKIQHYTNKGEK